MTRKRAATTTAPAVAKAAIKTPVEPKAETPTAEPVAPKTSKVVLGTEVEPEATPAAEPEAEPEATPAVEPPVVTEVKAEVPFGKDPDDLAGGDDEVDPDALIAAALAPDVSGVWATYEGERGDEVAITLIVPDPPEGYEAMVTSGRTYVLPLNKPKWVEAAHADWLRGHPAYRITTREP